MSLPLPVQNLTAPLKQPKDNQASSQGCCPLLCRANSRCWLLAPASQCAMLAPTLCSDSGSAHAALAIGCPLVLSATLDSWKSTGAHSYSSPLLSVQPCILLWMMERPVTSQKHCLLEISTSDLPLGLSPGPLFNCA